MGVYRTCLISGIDFVFKRHVIAVKWLWFLCSQVKLYLYFSKCGLLTWQDNYAVSTRVFVKMTSVSTTNLLILSNPHSLNYIFTSSNISNFSVAGEHFFQNSWKCYVVTKHISVTFIVKVMFTSYYSFTRRF